MHTPCKKRTHQKDVLEAGLPSKGTTRLQGPIRGVSVYVLFWDLKVTPPLGEKKEKEVKNEIEEKVSEPSDHQKIKEEYENLTKQEKAKLGVAQEREKRNLKKRVAERILKQNIKEVSSKEIDIGNIFASTYYHSDSTADGSLSDSGGSGIGNSMDYTSGNDINVYAQAQGMGAYWAFGANWDQFTYSAVNNNANVKINYRLTGGLATYRIPLDTAEAYIRIRLRVYDHTTNQELTNTLIFEDYRSGISGTTYDEDKSGQTTVYMQNGHVYTVELWPTVWASAGGPTAVAGSDFYQGDDRKVRWNYDEVWW